MAHVILDTLLAHGVDAMFGIPGGAVSALYDATLDRPAMRLVTTRHESAAVFAAMGYARVTGRRAAVVVTSGPGLTNAITGLAAAYAEGLPVVLIAGDIATETRGRFALQELDVVSLVRPITRFVARIERASAAQPLVTRALAEEGPTALVLPLDVARAAASMQRAAMDPRSLARALRDARRPMIVLGAGARHAPSVVTLAERTGAMVAATAHGKGAFPERHANYLGILGFGGHASALGYARDADLTVVIGSRLSDVSTNGWSALRAPIVQIDRDPAVLGRNYPLLSAVVDDAESAASAIAAHLGGSVAPRAPSVAEDPARDDDSAPLKPQFVLAALQRILPSSTIFTTDIGEHTAFAVHHLRVGSADQFHLNAGLGSMGSGLCGAIGIKLARPEVPVVAIVGDGGFAMHAGELQTCVDAGIAVTFVVLNDGRYRMCDLGFQSVYQRLPRGLPSEPRDLRAVAEALGAVGVRVEHARDLERIPLDRPAVLDVRIDAAEELSVATRTATIKHFAAGAR